MPRRTKIVATLGPATDDTALLTSVLKAGVDVVRINCSHSFEDLERRIKSVREVCKKNGLDVAILLDLQGPKIRIGKFKNGFVTLNKNANFVIDPLFSENDGDDKCVSTNYKNLPHDLKIGDVLLLDDGKISLRVVNIVPENAKNSKVHCQVIDGGLLKNNKGINILGGGLSAESLTEKDKQDLKLAAKYGVDYIALSFVRNKLDILATRKILEQEKYQPSIIAKIERSDALKNLDEIIIASDGVMVARGDLGVEIGIAELPSVQKHIINQARILDKPVITATQMMESMIENNLPTRAEVFDVANAVIDGTDAVMLSAETAAGKYPLEVVQEMAKICEGAERHHSTRVSGHRVECTFKRTDEAVAMAAMYVANHLDVKAIIALTESGATPLWMSRIRTAIPIYALTRFEKTFYKMKLYRGVYPIRFDVTLQQREYVNRNAIEELVRKNLLAQGDWVVMARGDFLGVTGGCNTLKILRVGDVN